LGIPIDNNTLGIQAHNAMPKAFAISKKSFATKNARARKFATYTSWCAMEFQINKIDLKHST
jgi:hypothetical protein